MLLVAVDGGQALADLLFLLQVHLERGQLALQAPDEGHFAGQDGLQPPGVDVDVVVVVAWNKRQREEGGKGKSIRE